jgi:uncharacterized repeat protein (TIGR01451 family)
MSIARRVICAFSLALCASFAIAASPTTVMSPPVTFPLAFEPNHGQTSAQVHYVARSREGTLFFTNDGVTIAIPHRGSFRMLFDGAQASSSISGERLLVSHSNYLDPEHGKAISGIENFGAIRYSQIYAGVDVRFYGIERHLEHEFQLAPGADVSKIAFKLEGIDRVRIAATGCANLSFGGTTLQESAPVAWQTINGQRVPVKVKWHLQAQNRLGFVLGAYDHTKAMTIDPVLAYSTHLGGHTAEDFSTETTSPADTIIEAIVLDPAKNIYVSGFTTAIDYPTTPGAFSRVPNQFTVFHEDTDSESGFVSKFDPSGHTLFYSTYLHNDVPLIAVDSTGHVYDAKGGQDNFAGPTDGFDTGMIVDKLSADGSKLLYSFTFGATAPNAPASCLNSFQGTIPAGIAADNAGHVWVSGRTDDNCLPTSSTAFEKTMPAGNTGAFVAKFDTSKTGAASIVYNTYLGGNASANIWRMTVDSTGNAYVVGNSTSSFPHGHTFGTATAADGGSVGFVTKLNATGSALVFSTIVHGMSSGFSSPPSVAIDASRNVYVAGETNSTGFPTTTGAFRRTLNITTCLDQSSNTTVPCNDGFVTKLNSTGSTLIFSTLLGGSSNDRIAGIQVNNANMPFVTGATSSANFPTTSNGFKRTYPSGATQQAFVTAFNADGKSLYYSTLLGGSKNTFADTIFVDPAWNAWVGGNTSDVDYPVTADAFTPALNGNSDGFIGKVVIASDLSLSATATASAVSRNTIDTFLETVTNKGPDFAQNVVLSNPIPAGFSFQGITFSTASSCKAPAIGAATGSIVCTKSQLNSAASMQLHFKLKVIAASGSNLVDKATVTSHMQDLNKANNSASVTVHVK